MTSYVCMYKYIFRPGITISQHNCAERIHTYYLCSIIQSSIRLQQAHMSADDIIFFFMFTLKKYFMLKNSIFKIQSLIFLQAHFDCFNRQVNNLDGVKRQQLLLQTYNNIWKKLKAWLLAREEIYELKLVSNKYLINIIIIKPKMYNIKDVAVVQYVVCWLIRRKSLGSYPRSVIKNKI